HAPRLRRRRREGTWPQRGAHAWAFRRRDRAPVRHRDGACRAARLCGTRRAAHRTRDRRHRLPVDAGLLGRARPTPRAARRCRRTPHRATLRAGGRARDRRHRGARPGRARAPSEGTRTVTTALARPNAPTLPAVRRRLARGGGVGSGVRAVLLAVIVATGRCTGACPIGPERVLPRLLGAGESKDAFVLFRLRLPRIVLGVLAGVAFGIAGAPFQTLLRNPLASPDIIGISGGAGAAAAFGILLLGARGGAVSPPAVGGALEAAPGV